jgi:multimeric flavodoxin WrbA
MSRVLVISCSPRRDGNSRRLAEAALAGARDAGDDAGLVRLDDHVRHVLRDCRVCRGTDGRCTIDDDYESLLRDHVLAADGTLPATPVPWYGVSGQLKTFLDRMFCCIAASSPDADEYARRIVGKRRGLLLSSEETYPGASLGVVHQIQEYARYTHAHPVGVVRGIGNERGDVALDPSAPIDAARELGRTLLSARATDFRLDTVRPGSTCAQAT